MRPPASIRSRLLAFGVVSLGLTAFVALAGALLVRTTHVEDSRITADVSAGLRRSHLALDQLVAAQISLQTLLRQKDPDEIEAGIKPYDATRQLAATHLAGLGDTVQPPFLRLTVAGKAVINDILTGHNSDALQKFVET